MTFDSDHILLALNGLAYLGLFFAYMYTAAKHEPPIIGAHVAGYTSIVFAIMFFLRALDVLESDDFWLDLADWGVHVCGWQYVDIAGINSPTN